MDLFFLAIVWAGSYGGAYAALEASRERTPTSPWRNAFWAAGLSILACTLITLLLVAFGVQFAYSEYLALSP